MEWLVAYENIVVIGDYLTYIIEALTNPIFASPVPQKSGVE